MRVLINTLAHGRTGGGMTYLRSVLPHLVNDDNDYVLLVPPDRGKLLGISGNNVHIKQTKFPLTNRLLRLSYEQIVLPYRIRDWEVDVLLSPAGITPLAAPCPAVLALPNPNPYFTKEELNRPVTTRWKFKLLKVMNELSAWKAVRVYSVSRTATDRIKEILSVDDEKISTIYHGVDADRFQAHPEPTNQELTSVIACLAPYILTVSTITEHKNYETLLEGYSRLPGEIRARYPLVIVGKTASDKYHGLLQRIARAEGIEDRVKFVGQVADDDLPYIYSKAFVYILPAKLETFGLTLVEAMASGLPVLASDATCIPEITGGAALLFNPDDPDALAEALESTIRDESLRGDLVDRSRDRATDFSWKKSANELRELLHAAMNSR